MILKNINHNYEYEAQKLCTAFFPDEKIKSAGDSDIEVVTALDGEIFTVSARMRGREERMARTLREGEDGANALSVLMYKTLSALTGFKPPWGILFGVRPAKLMHRYAAEMGESGAREHFINSFLVSPAKADLALEVMGYENQIISLSRPNSFSLYVAIPFCPTRCAYCSFVSHSIERTQKLVEPYVRLLCSELEHIGKITAELSLRLETVYFGGGTPTTLTAAQLEQIFKTIEKNFDLSALREYTVEAGRPDTISRDKLLALKAAGVGRISINPQSFNDDVLRAIGRRHTSRQTLDAFDLAVKCGFDNINTDLIAGLPRDSVESFKNSVDTAISLGASSVTVHALAMKSAAYMVTDEQKYDMTGRLTAADMVDYSALALKSGGYHPYYMYRQSKSVGNLENTGWCKSGGECLYNVYMMDETHSVFAAGAGAVTRLKNPDTGKIERIYNLKYPYEYIDRFDEMLARKNTAYDFYINC